MTSVHELRERHAWTPIAGCPGRLRLGPTELTPTELTGQTATVYDVPDVDAIHVVPMPDGGVLSYAHPDGSYVHTLCDECGLQRKLRALGLVDAADAALDEAVAEHVFQHHRAYRTAAEVAADRALLAREKAAATRSEAHRARYARWETPEAVALADLGPAGFVRRVAGRILAEHGVALNRCPRCHGLCRTPRARQCPHCSHAWHPLA